MFGTPADVIQCLSDDLSVEHNLIIDEIKSSPEMRAIFRDVVEDFSEYETLRDSLADRF